MKSGFVIKYKQPQDSNERPEYVLRTDNGAEFTGKRIEATLFNTKDEAMAYLDDHGMKRKYWFSFKTTIESPSDFSSDKKRSYPSRSFKDNKRAS